jgi:hypothetical protein
MLEWWQADTFDPETILGNDLADTPGTDISVENGSYDYGYTNHLCDDVLPGGNRFCRCG